MLLVSIKFEVFGSHLRKNVSVFHNLIHYVIYELILVQDMHLPSLQVLCLDPMPLCLDPFKLTIWRLLDLFHGITMQMTTLSRLRLKFPNLLILASRVILIGLL